MVIGTLYIPYIPKTSKLYMRLLNTLRFFGTSLLQSAEEVQFPEFLPSRVGAVAQIPLSVPSDGFCQ